MKHKQGIIILLLLIELFNALTAIVGGFGLVWTNGLSMPIAWLHNSPFSSFVLPGLILLIIVGGTNAVAALFIWKNYRYTLAASAIAGFGMLIWIFSEMYIIKQMHLLQIFYFGTGIAVLVLTYLLLNEQRRTYET